MEIPLLSYRILLEIHIPITLTPQEMSSFQDLCPLRMSAVLHRGGTENVWKSPMLCTSLVL